MEIMSSVDEPFFRNIILLFIEFVLTFDHFYLQSSKGAYHMATLRIISVRIFFLITQSELVQNYYIIFKLKNIRVVGCQCIWYGYFK